MPGHGACPPTPAPFFYSPFGRRVEDPTTLEIDRCRDRKVDRWIDRIDKQRYIIVAVVL